MIISLKAERDAAYIGVWEGDKLIASDSWDSGRELARDLLARINTAAKSAGLSLTQLAGLVVFKGPGSFTSLRIAISTVNALAYAHGIPIVGVVGENWEVDGLVAIQRGTNDLIVMPEYGAEAHITAPRK